MICKSAPLLDRVMAFVLLQVEGSRIALHITRGRSVEDVSPPPSCRLPADVAANDSHIDRLLGTLRLLRKEQGGPSAAAAVQAAMAAAFQAQSRGAGACSSSSLSDGGSAGSGGRSRPRPLGHAPTMSKRQAVGEPDKCSALKRQDDDDDEGYRGARPSVSSSAASVLLRPTPEAATATRRSEGKARKETPAMGIENKGGALDTNRDPFGRDLSCDPPTISSASWCNPSDPSDGLGDGCSSGSGTARRPGCSAMSDVLLEHYPETRAALEAYRSSKQGAQVGARDGERDGKHGAVIHLF